MKSYKNVNKKNLQKKKNNNKKNVGKFWYKKPEEDEIKKIIIKNDPKQNKLQLKEWELN
jgi:hypothetical protein